MRAAKLFSLWHEDKMKGWRRQDPGVLQNMGTAARFCSYFTANNRLCAEASEMCVSVSPPCLPGSPQSPVETPVPVADPGFLAGSSLLKPPGEPCQSPLPKVELKVGINVQGAQQQELSLESQEDGVGGSWRDCSMRSCLLLLRG